MNEFPVSNLERRIMWGIACGASAMLLSFGTPLLLMKIGIDPKWTGSGGFGAGMGLGLLVLSHTVLSGLAGLIAGIVRPGIQAVMITLICLVLADIGMTGASRLYSISAATKFVLMIVVIKLDQKYHQAS